MIGVRTCSLTRQPNISFRNQILDYKALLLGIFSSATLRYGESVKFVDERRETNSAFIDAPIFIYNITFVSLLYVPTPVGMSFCLFVHTILVNICAQILNIPCGGSYEVI